MDEERDDVVMDIWLHLSDAAVETMHTAAVTIV